MTISYRLVLVMTLVAACAGGSIADEPASQPVGTFFHVDQLNPGLSPPDKPVNLATPQACVEHYMLSCRREQWDRAAHALNFRLVEPVDPATGRRLARHLYDVLNQNLWIDWSLLPDRPDGVEAGSMLTSSDPMAGKPRRSIPLGSITLDGRDVPIRVQRVKPAAGRPVWVFSAQTVDNIEALYKVWGPSWLEANVPQWSRDIRFLRVPLWQWLAVVVLLVLAMLVGWLVAKIVTTWLAARLAGDGMRLVEAIRWPAAVLTAGLASYISVGTLLTLPGPVSTVALPILMTVVVLSGTWLAVRVLGVATRRLTEDRDSQELTIDESGSLARLTVFRYVLVVLIIAVGISVLLITMDVFRTLGVALLSSAGAAAVVIGIAGHAVLGNLIAGVQIAITRPFRIGDTVIIEGYWGRIEQLRYTHVIVRTWDEKRLVLPVQYFMSNWFENWSKTDQYTRKAIYLKVDYRADVQTIREKFMEFVRDDEDWAKDLDEPDVLVTECGEETLTVRLTCGGADAGSAWQLNCRVREKLVAWLQQYEDGTYLPRRRVVLHRAQQDRQASGAQEKVEPQPASEGGDEGGNGGDT
jgi:small-conductance mechanosensitive channel